MAKKIEIDEAYLKKVILKEGKSPQEVARILKIDGRTVIKNCKKYNIDSSSRDLVKIGDKCGLLQVVSFYGYDKHGHKKWNCECECGNKKVLVGHVLKNGNTRSCGCLRYNPLKRKCKNPFGISMKNEIIASYKCGAKNRKLDFKLTDEDLDILFQGNCTYCNCPPSSKRNRRNTNGEYVYNGIDRQENYIGYLKNNCVSCCTRCNVGKNKSNKNDFIRWIRKVYNHTKDWELND